jgi:SAM-dependent methyltransferase
MFFKDRIKNIKPSDRVLEIGPGADPYFRSDVLLEKKFGTEEEYVSQFGNTHKLQTDKPVIFYEGDLFPFADKEFDYVICSHVLEHVENLELFLSEVFRVGSKGYFEYPLIYYDYLYNFDVHVNYLKFDQGSLKYMKKSDSALSEFQPVQEFFYQSLNKGYDQIVRDLLYFFMEGYEWEQPFTVKQVTTIKEICFADAVIPFLKQDKPPAPTFLQLFKQLLRKVLGN